MLGFPRASYGAEVVKDHVPKGLENTALSACRLHEANSVVWATGSLTP